AVELRRPQAALLGDRLDVPGPVVPEHADRRHERRQPGDDRRGHVGRDVARRALDEDEAEGIGARLHAEPRVLRAGDPAELDLHRSDSSRILAATAPARSSVSPTRTAWAPASTTRATSAPLASPLSLTASGPGGIWGSRVSEGSRLVASV